MTNIQRPTGQPLQKPGRTHPQPADHSAHQGIHGQHMPIGPAVPLQPRNKAEDFLLRELDCLIRRAETVIAVSDDLFSDGGIYDEYTGPAVPFQPRNRYGAVHAQGLGKALQQIGHAHAAGGWRF